jgi:hypothetical protein
MKKRIHQTISCSLSTIAPQAKQGSLRIGFALLALLLLPFGQVRGAWGAYYHGQVVDAETGKPIEGAVVMVEWHKRAIYSMDGGGIFHNARETVTDSDGKFSLDSSEGINWNPLTFVQAPRIIAFYPGYLPFTPGNPGEIKGGLYEIAETLERGAVIKLTRLKTEKELRNFTDKSGVGSIRAPYAMLPNFLRLINVQRKMVGLDELQFP